METSRTRRWGIWAWVIAIHWCVLPVSGEEVRVAGLEKPVEVLRDKWGVPHIYAQSSKDLFFAQGWVTARDRLFQIDLWRRVGTGKLSEVLGAQALGRDRIARLVQYRGDWGAEWRSYSDDAKEIATSFTAGINAYIKSLGGKRPLEFRAVGYDPGLWVPEDITARMAGLVMVRNLAREVARAGDIRKFGLETVQRMMPPDPYVKIEIPKGLDLNGIGAEILRDYNLATGSVKFADALDLNSMGSNNWVMSGKLTATGKPLLANDPHRPIQNPSLRKTVHLVGPGWNVIGAGEPALPGIALGHNEEMGFGFTIVGIDQADLYVETVDKADPTKYLYKGEWKKMRVLQESILVKGEAKPRVVELKYTMHGPVIGEAPGRAFALKWVGSEPGSAGYLGALRLARARNWGEFEKAAAYYKIPSENLVYADRAGNIGWIAGGWSPVRKNWTGLLPVPGHTGEYEWNGYMPVAENPKKFNPAEGFVATANHNILPAGYSKQLAYEWAAPWRQHRLLEMIGEKKVFGIPDFQRMQQDVRSHAGKKMVEVVKAWGPRAQEVGAREMRVIDRFLRWDGGMGVDSAEAVVYALWSAKLGRAAFGAELGARMELGVVLEELRKKPNGAAMLSSLRAALGEGDKRLGRDETKWRWGALHKASFQHVVPVKAWDLGAVEKPGDATTVNAASGGNYQQTAGGSYRQILDVADWDRSVTTNTPGESGVPGSAYYGNLLKEWASGGYHPLVYSRKAVEANTVERTTLRP